MDIEKLIHQLNDIRKRTSGDSADAFRLPKEERARLRSKTFPGIAKAIAEQWG